MLNERNDSINIIYLHLKSVTKYQQTIDLKEGKSMTKKIICIVLAMIMLIANCSLAAYALDNTDEIITHVEEVQAAAYNPICALFGHSANRNFSWFTVNTMCVHIGDSYCLVKCIRNEYCARCGEYITYSYFHAAYACLQDGYVCQMPHPATNY